MTRLKWLYLSNARVTDAGLAQLKDLTSLQSLELNCTQVTDVGLAHVRRMTKLEEFQLNETGVTDAGLVYVMGLNRMSRLSLGGTQVSDAGLGHLRRLGALRVIWLDRTQVTETGVLKLHLALPWLEVIDYEVKMGAIGRRLHVELTGPRVTDNYLRRICGSVGQIWGLGGRVVELTLTRTKVTDAGVAEVERALPGVIVYH